MAGTWGKVSRIVAVAALVALVATGCGGGAAQPHDSAGRGVPPTLAHEWANQASAIAAAAAAGDDCHALQLASSLRDQVIAAERRVPDRLRSPLVSGVNALADRLTCTVTVPAPPTTQAKPHEKPPPKHGHHDHHGHGGDEQKDHG